MKQELLQKIKDKTLNAGVIGLGYVGLPLAVELASSGYKTIGFDTKKEKVEQVNAGMNYISDVNDSVLHDLVEKDYLVATTDFSYISQVDFLSICVPTPLDKHQQPDVSYIESAVKEVAKYIKYGTVIVLESTTYPGTTEELVKPILEKNSKLVCEKDFYLGFSPERVDPGNKLYKTKNTPKIVGAIGADAQEVVAGIYRSFLESEIYIVSSPAVAEMEKILENTYRNVNIGLINEMAMLCERVKINIWEVIEAAKTKPYGFEAFYPGPGLGGHCIPLDPYYLSWKVREYGFHTSMIENSMMINDRMPEYCVNRISAILNLAHKPLSGSLVLVLGIAYKQDINDYRESPAIHLIELLKKQGVEIIYYDPWISKYSENGITYKGISSLTEKNISAADLVVITTAHSNINYKKVQKYAKVIFDTRNAMKFVEERDNIILL